MEQSHRLQGSIMETIRMSQEKAISFRDYMEQCLYDENYGYYMSDKEKIGRSGDFYTSASIGGIMGEVLARYISNLVGKWNRSRPSFLVEWGSGTGNLARQILDELRAHAPEVYAGLNYISIERSPVHRAVQAEKLMEHQARVQWMTEQEWLHQGGWERTIVLSNELTDAFPVHKVQIHHGQPHEVMVGLDETGQGFMEKLVKLHEGPVLDYVHSIGLTLEEGQQLEVNLEAIQWIRRVGDAIRSGEVLTIDYGDQEKELYAPYRKRGTLLCYEKHQANDNPYVNPGSRDITAHVNFSALERAGRQAGLVTKAFVTQKQFLVDNGILELLQDTMTTDPFSPAAKRNRAIRQLLLSDQMSELFKVLVQKKGELL